MFNIVLSNIVIMLVYMLIGFTVCKSGKVNATHAKSFSGLLLYVLNPAMMINSFLRIEYSTETLAKIGKFALITFLIQLVFIFTRPFAYATCALKLVVYPLFAYLCVMWLPFLDEVAKVTVFVLSAAPAGAIIESLSELHECEQELSANVVLLTTILSIFTMPLLMKIV